MAALGELLLETQVASLLTGKPDIIDVPLNTPVGDVVELMRKNYIVAVPVKSVEKEEYVGFKTAYVAFASYSHVWEKQKEGEVSVHTSYDSEEERTLKNIELTSPIEELVGATEEGKSYYECSPQTPLLALLEPFASGIHRLVVRDGDMANIISQTDFVQFLEDQKSVLGDVLRLSVEELGMVQGPDHLVCVNEKESGIMALRKMKLHEVPAVAVVNDKGELSGALSCGCFRGMTEETLKNAFLPVLEFASKTQPVYSKSFAWLPPTASLGEFLRVAVKTKFHRVFVLDEKRRPIGVLSLTDIILAVGKSSQLLE